MASICCSPPESVPDFCARRSFNRGNSSKTRSMSVAIPALSLRMYAPSSRFSVTVIRGKMRRPSGLWAMPRAATSWPFNPDTRCPSNLISPRFSLINPEIARIVVDLPAPLPPMSVTISPGYTVSEMPLTAEMLP